MWPIVATINNLPPQIRTSKANIQLMALWSGKQQPNLQKFTIPILQHLSSLYRQGTIIQYKDTNNITQKVKVRVIVSNWMLDLKAKAPLQNFKSSGYYSCGYCNIEGTYLQGTVVFPPSLYNEKPIQFRNHDNICIGDDSIAGNVQHKGENVEN